MSPASSLRYMFSHFNYNPPADNHRPTQEHRYQKEMLLDPQFNRPAFANDTSPQSNRGAGFQSHRDGYRPVDSHTPLLPFEELQSSDEEMPEELDSNHLHPSLRGDNVKWDGLHDFRRNPIDYDALDRQFNQKRDTDTVNSGYFASPLQSRRFSSIR